MDNQIGTNRDIIRETYKQYYTKKKNKKQVSKPKYTREAKLLTIAIQTHQDTYGKYII